MQQLGFVACNDIESCVQWRTHARECMGEEMHNIVTAQMKGSFKKYLLWRNH